MSVGVMLFLAQQYVPVADAIENISECERLFDKPVDDHRGCPGSLRLRSPPDPPRAQVDGPGR